MSVPGAASAALRRMSPPLAADDGVAAIQGRERAHGIQGAHQGREPLARAMQAGRGRRRASVRTAPPAGPRCCAGAPPDSPATGGRAVQPARARVREDLAQRRETGAAPGRPGAATCSARRAPGLTCAARPISQRNRSRCASIGAAGRAAAAAPRRAQGGEPFLAVGHDDFGGGGRRRRAHVRGEIGDREIDLVADAADDRDRRGDDRARQRFVVEGPQILERAAAAGQDQHVAFAPGGRPSAGRRRSPRRRPRPARAPDRSAPERRQSAAPARAGCRESRRRSAR